MLVRNYKFIDYSDEKEPPTPSLRFIEDPGYQRSWILHLSNKIAIYQNTVGLGNVQYITQNQNCNFLTVQQSPGDGSRSYDASGN